MWAKYSGLCIVTYCMSESILTAYKCNLVNGYWVTPMLACESLWIVALLVPSGRRVWRQLWCLPGRTGASTEANDSVTSVGRQDKDLDQEAHEPTNHVTVQGLLSLIPTIVAETIKQINTNSGGQPSRTQMTKPVQWTKPLSRYSAKPTKMEINRWQVDFCRHKRIQSQTNLTQA